MSMSNDGSIQLMAHQSVLLSQAKIGPNAIIQTVAALQDLHGAAEAATILQQAQHADLNDHLPTEMIHEAEFHTLAAALTAVLGLAQTQQVLRQSGQGTARYLLAHRIPKPFQWLIKQLPWRMGLALLLMAIRQHAWTFVGSGVFTYTLAGQPRLIIVRENPADEAVYSFYTGTFEALLQELINAQIHLHEKTDQVGGATRYVATVTRG